jgi:GNAT superfamily N-acetyltransferase
MVDIVAYRNNDRDGLFALFAEWDKDRVLDRAEFMASLDQVAADPDALILAKLDGRLLGYAQLAPGQHLGAKPYLEVVQLLVAESERGRGVGGLLMRRAEEFAAAKGLGAVELSSRVHRSKAHVFYEGLGYRLRKVSKFYRKELAAD